MQLTFRWYGPDDPIPLAHIRQIPGLTGIVSALHGVPPGAAWPSEKLKRRRQTVEEAGLRLAVIESLPVHEDIKLGRPTRDRYIDAFCQSLELVGRSGVPVVCYNFMPVFDWTRTRLDAPLLDGSTSLAYDDASIGETSGPAALTDLPGWATAYAPGELRALTKAYQSLDAEQLWAHLAYFLERVVPVAEAAGVRLALHPDDPPWPVLGVPRIITSVAALRRVTRLVDRPANGLTLCTGSLGADPASDLPAAARDLSARIHFVHARNVTVSGTKRFQETAHPDGDVDLAAVLRALREAGYDGPMRPDHGRVIWGEGERPNARPGYGLYDRALGAAYLHGLWNSL